MFYRKKRMSKIKALINIFITTHAIEYKLVKYFFYMKTKF